VLNETKGEICLHFPFQQSTVSAYKFLLSYSKVILFPDLDFDWSYKEYDWGGVTCVLCNSYEEEMRMALDTNGIFFVMVTAEHLKIMLLITHTRSN
jgi:hypothetical protein